MDKLINDVAQFVCPSSFFKSVLSFPVYTNGLLDPSDSLVRFRVNNFCGIPLNVVIG